MSAYTIETAICNMHVLQEQNNGNNSIHVAIRLIILRVVLIREFRDVHGDFYSKFDLHHFPTDIQELNVSIGSALFDTEVTLEADPNRASGINREAFIDQQEWKLYDHIETKTKFIKGFLFHNDEDDELDTPEYERKRSISISELSLIEKYRK